jgi:hypothetical protein
MDIPLNKLSIEPKTPKSDNGGMSNACSVGCCLGAGLVWVPGQTSLGCPVKVAELVRPSS